MSKKFRVTPTLDWHKADAASTANVTVASMDAGQTVDGVVLAAGDTVLLKNQTTAAENGLYTINADTVAPTRHVDWPAGADRSGHVVRVYGGTANSGTAWVAYAEPGIVGTDAPNFVQHELT